MNIKIRFKNPIFIVQLVLAIILSMITYAGITARELTTWGALADLLLDSVSNPYVLATVIASTWNALYDTTTKGFFDSLQVRNYMKSK